MLLFNCFRRLIGSKQYFTDCDMRRAFDIEITSTHRPSENVNRDKSNRLQFLFLGSFVVVIVNLFQNRTVFLALGQHFNSLSINGLSSESTFTSEILQSKNTPNIRDFVANDEHHTSSDKPSCLRQQINPGKWIPITLDNPPYISKTMHLRCQIPDYDYDNPGPWPSWLWQPDDSSCHLNGWNATTFCDLVPFSTISVIGDSLSWEQYSSLLQLLGSRVHQSDQHRSLLEDRNIVYFSCRIGNRGTKFVFRNDPQLKAETISDSISRDFPTVLIINRGAHYVDDEVLLLDINRLLPVLLSWQKVCTETYKKCHLFWRTTVPGHTRCEEYSSPVNDITLMESLVESRENYNNETIWNFRWQDFKRQNNLVLKELSEYGQTYGLEYEIIDGYEINILRPDRHRWHQNDCLHSCYPGKMDVYNQLLQHYLMVQRRPQDVQYMIDRIGKVHTSKVADEITR